MNPAGLPRLEPGDLLTPQELADRLKVKKRWIYEQTGGEHKNPIPHLHCGKHLRFVWPEVCAWLRNERG